MGIPAMASPVQNRPAGAIRTVEERTPTMSQNATTISTDVPVFTRPYPWSEISDLVRRRGGALLRGLVDVALVERFNAEVDAWLEDNPRASSSNTGSGLYDRFLGRRTLR